MNRRGRITVFLVLAAAATWFGFKLGPREAQRPATPELAIEGAHTFVTEAEVEAPGSAGEPVFDQGSEAVAAQDKTDPEVWTVTGTATVRIQGSSSAVPIRWCIRQRWDGRHRWKRLRAEIWKPSDGKNAAS